jgi:hypothetical protein
LKLEFVSTIVSITIFSCRKKSQNNFRTCLKHPQK